MPARSAGPSSATSSISTPVGRRKPSACATSLVTGRPQAPSQGRCSRRPPPEKLATTECTMFDGTAKPMPMEPPLCE